MRFPRTLPALLASLALAAPVLRGQEDPAPAVLCGDLNGDDTVDVSDSIYLLRFLFLGADPPRCAFLPPGSDLAGGTVCERASGGALESCRQEGLAEYWLTRGRCETLADPEEQAECREEAREELDSALEECAAVREARLDLCDSVSGFPWDVEIDPEDFVDGAANPYYPLVPGTTLVYEKETEDGLEHIEVTVTEDTREILGVECTVIRDTVTVDGELAEDTYDWYAADRAGNVWYFGELSFEYEDGEIAGTAGSWEAGVDGARPGIIMAAQPVPGAPYFQEFLLAEAEDAGRVLSVSETVEVPAGTFEGCVKTADYTPLEPGVFEEKYYAAGVGVVLEVDIDDGSRLELIEIRRP